MPTCSTFVWIQIRTAIAKVVLSILGLLLLAAFNDNGVIAGTHTAINCRSNGCPSLVDPLLAGNAPASDAPTRRRMVLRFRNSPHSVHYVLAAVNMAASSYVDASILVTTSGTPEFVYNIQPNNTCAYPAHVRFLLQEKGDDLSETNGKAIF